jgi:hypothetical protein
VTALLEPGTGRTQRTGAANRSKPSCFHVFSTRRMGKSIRWAPLLLACVCKNGQTCSTSPSPLTVTTRSPSPRGHACSRCSASSVIQRARASWQSKSGCTPTVCVCISSAWRQTGWSSGRPSPGRVDVPVTCGRLVPTRYPVDAPPEPTRTSEDGSRVRSDRAVFAGSKPLAVRSEWSLPRPTTRAPRTR